VLSNARSKDPEWDSVVARLLNEEKQRKGNEVTYALIANNTTVRVNRKSCTHWGCTNHNVSKYWKHHLEQVSKWK
jgi:hypothetical protein